MDDHIQKIVQILNRECCAKHNKITWTVTDLERTHCAWWQDGEMYFELCTRCSSNLILVNMVILMKKQYDEVVSKLDLINKTLSDRLEIIEDCVVQGHNYVRDDSRRQGMYIFEECTRCGSSKMW